MRGTRGRRRDRTKAATLRALLDVPLVPRRDWRLVRAGATPYCASCGKAPIRLHVLADVTSSRPTYVASVQAPGKGEAVATTASTTTSGSDGAGEISDVLAGFAAQAAKPPVGPTPDANVACACALGWTVGDALMWAQHGTSEHLSKVPDLDSGAEPWNLLINQITSRLQKLHDHLKGAGNGLDLSGPLTASTTLHLDLADSADVNTAVRGKAEAAKSVNDTVLNVLWSTEPALGKAYQLGRHLEQMCADPTVNGNSVSVQESVGAQAKVVHPLLMTLASKLPSNSAHATDNSLRLWWATLLAEAGKDTAETLLDQGSRWRVVLAGDVAGTDGLHLGDYMYATDSVAVKLRDTAKQIAIKFWPWLFAALVVAAGGIVLIIVDTKGTVGAGIAAIIAALGVTWKGIGEFFGRVAARGEDYLWDAELDWAIAHRFTLCHQLAPDALKALAGIPEVDKPTAAHVARFSEWKRVWPDVDFTSPPAASTAA